MHEHFIGENETLTLFLLFGELDGHDMLQQQPDARMADPWR